MADTDILVSEMTPASQINTTDLMIMTQPDAGAETGYTTKSGTVLQVANKMLKGTEYSTDLPDFTDKSVLGGLEELKASIESLFPVDSASGDIASFETDLSEPLVDCESTIVATGGYDADTQTAHPINGYTEANITRCGVNLWDEEWELGNINSSGEPIPSTVQMRATNYIPCTPNTNYYQGISGGLSSDIVTYFYDANKTFIPYTGAGAYNNGANPSNGLFTSPQNAVFMLFRLGAAYGTTYNNDISINYPSSDTSYHAYNGNTYTIAFGQTVYGGVLDVTRGKLTVTHEFETFTISGYSAKDVLGSYIRYRYNLANSVKENDSNQLCNLATYEASYSSDTLHFYCANTTATAYRAFAFLPNGIDESGTVEFCYPLEMPFDIDLTPVQIEALLGVNNVFSDTNGTTEVKFKDTIQHYIDKKIAETQALVL